MISFAFEGGLMGQKNVTLSLDEEIYERYKEFCKENGLALSRTIEIHMKERMRTNNE